MGDAQESAVLALGAIAHGCLQGLVQFLPGMLELLLRLLGASQPLLRSISCWCVSRYSNWICIDKKPNSEEILRQVFASLLPRLLDGNKHVQEAANGALTTLLMEPNSQLLPFLDDIVEILVRAFQCYQ